MTGKQSPTNLAARMGRWSAGHWKTAVFGWLAFVVVTLAIGGVVGTRNIDLNDANVGEAHRADHMLRDAGFRIDPQAELVLVQSTTDTARSASFRAVVQDVVGRVAKSPNIESLRSPYTRGNEGQISRDGRTALVEWNMKGDNATATKHIEPLLAATKAVAASHPSYYVGEAGSISSGKALNAEFGKQLALAGERSVPLTLLVLLIVFGALVAAGLPLLLALSAVLATLGLLSLPSHLVPMDQNVSAVVLLIGLAVGVDYSLFYLKREREERRAGKGPEAALATAAATSGRSVLISGVTVMIAMAGMIFSGDKTFISFGIATMLVVAVAMLGSLTVLPALLSKLGDRVDKGRIPFLRRFARSGGDSRFWSSILTPALRHPAVSALASTAVLVVLAVPTVRLHTAQTGLDSLPKGVPTVETIDRIQHTFPGGATPADIAIAAPADSPATKAAIHQLVQRALASGQMDRPITIDVNAARTMSRILIPLQGSGTDDRSTAALRTLRDTILPQTIGKLPNATYAVTGGTAASTDWTRMMKHAAPLVFGFVLMFAFLLLLMAFRSVVVAFKAIVLNLLSVAAAYGVIVATFQWGWGEGPLRFHSNGGVAAWLPIFLFVILFGLSMDYHVFVLSRIREGVDRGMATGDAVSHGIKNSAGVVTSAAIVMVGVFSIFATLPIIDMKQMGIGLAAAVLIDATIVRAVLLPATMKLLGEWNWYLPVWLEWLPGLDAEGRVDAHDAPPVMVA